MKKMFTSIAKAISNFVNAHTAAAVATAAVVVVTAIAVPVGIHMSSSGKAPIDTVQAEENETSSANAVSSKKEDASSVEETINETVNESSSNLEASTVSKVESSKQEAVSSEKTNSTDKTSSKATVSSKKETTSKKQTTSSKKTSTTSKKTTSKPNTKYVDDNKNTSKLTGTDEDIGKEVGYSTMLDKKITVVDVTEGINGRGLRYIETTYSDGTCDCVVECAYCHKMPCPKGGGEKCSEYNKKEDASKTCPDCALPYGDGYNNTCYKTIDWDNGGKTTCHHYD